MSLCTDVGTTSLNAILPADEASVGNYQVEVLGVMRGRDYSLCAAPGRGLNTIRALSCKLKTLLK